LLPTKHRPPLDGDATDHGGGHQRAAENRDHRRALGEHDPLRRAMRTRSKVAFRYRDGDGIASERTVRPLSLAFFGATWLLAAWCELRADFRSFRPDRMTAARVLSERFRPEPGKTLADFRARQAVAD
jgi:predicted DNA-binding transcriptional regulator YafY